MYPKTGSPRISIACADKRVMWSLDPNTKTYSQAKMPDWMERVINPEEVYDWSENGMEIIDGHKCRKFIGRFQGEPRPIGDAHEVCFIDAKTGMRRRVMTFDAKGKLALTIDYLNVKVGPPPRRIFEIPEGYKRKYTRRKLADG
jgi:hypothetical protein